MLIACVILASLFAYYMVGALLYGVAVRLGSTGKGEPVFVRCEAYLPITFWPLIIATLIVELVLETASAAVVGVWSVLRELRIVELFVPHLLYERVRKVEDRDAQE